MAQYRLDNKQLGQPGNRYEVVMIADKWGDVIPNPANPQGMAVDAFGRMRVAQPFTLFDSQHRYREGQQWDSNTAGSASKTYNQNASSVLLTVTGANNDQVIYETRRVFAYQPGKSLYILNTFTMAAANTTLRQRAGYFGPNNGVFLEQNGSALNLVIRTSANGSMSETRVVQSNWNGDTFDGNGPSERTIDITKTQIFFIDIEWLGVGAVRCGFMVDGVPYVAHTFYHDNREVLPYMQTATLPLRYEITRTATSTANATLQQICASVISEGGYEDTGSISSAGRELSYKSLTANTQSPIVSIRLNSNTLDAVVVIAQVDGAIESTNKDRNVFFRIVRNATLTNAGFLAHAEGVVDYDINATAVSGGTEIASGYFTAGRAVSLGGAQTFRNQLGRFINGTAEVYTLTFKPDTNLSAAGQLGWYTLVG
jgi:hypothetical protein